MADSTSKTGANKAESFFRIDYRDPKDGQIVSLKVRQIRDSSLGLGFVAISGFLFDPESSSIVNPIEEQLKQRFADTKSLHLSVYSIVSIEELGMEHRGLAFKKDRSNLVAFPSGGGEPPVKR